MSLFSRETVFERSKCIGPLPMCQGMQGVEDPVGQAQLAGQFTWSLLQQPHARMKHADVRRHPLLAPLKLPSYEDGPEQVELWLQHRDARRVELQTDGKARSASGLSDAVSSTTSEMAVVWD
ncbi:Uncharacterized protein SCF082_LOCUS48601 [Durusdinium trenchii]|uniref:Aurora kinase n=1 Tax=Durusdinium trenchii TaxID=1381693 RepID=A0ABP0RXS1_9DINO